MKKKLIKRNKRKLSRFLRIAKKNNLRMSDCIDLIRRVAEAKEANRMEARHGSYEDWEGAEPFFMPHSLSVPIRLKHTHAIIGYKIVNVDELPSEYEHLKGLSED